MRHHALITPTQRMQDAVIAVSCFSIYYYARIGLISAMVAFVSALEKGDTTAGRRQAVHTKVHVTNLTDGVDVSKLAHYRRQDRREHSKRQIAINSNLLLGTKAYLLLSVFDMSSGIVAIP